MAALLPGVAVLVLLGLAGALDAATIDVVCQGDPGTDARAINDASASSSVGDRIAIHGRCVVSETVVVLERRAYTGDSRTGTVIVQANGSNLVAVMASGGFLRNNTWTDTPTSVRHLTIDGNAAGNLGAPRPTAGLALRAYFSTVDDVRVQNCLGDGMLLGSATPQLGNGPNSRYSNSWFANNGGHGIHVDGETTDSNLVNCWVSDSGRSAIYLKSAAGWQISGNHLYATSEHAIFAEACFATAIHDNYIEDFARNNTLAPHAAQTAGVAADGAGGRRGRAGTPARATGSRYYGIGCRVQGGATTIISNNKVYRFSPSGSGAGRAYKEDATFVYIGVDRVNYGTGVVSGRWAVIWACIHSFIRCSITRAIVADHCHCVWRTGSPLLPTGQRARQHGPPRQRIQERCWAVVQRRGRRQRPEARARERKQPGALRRQRGRR